MNPAVGAKDELLAGSLREKTVDAARRHKASWIELAQYLKTVYAEKYFRQWGYTDFEAYCMRELGIKQTTAAKLLKSYSFIEKEEPSLAAPGAREEAKPQSLPGYEAVNLLRLAKSNDKITERDYRNLREAVIESGREPKEIRAQVKKILAARDDRDPGEVRLDRRNGLIKRIVSILSTARRECEAGKLLPGSLLKEMSDLAEKLEGQIE